MSAESGRLEAHRNLAWLVRLRWFAVASQALTVVPPRVIAMLSTTAMSRLGVIAP